MWQKIDYGYELKNHYTIPELLVDVEKSIKEKYSKVPTQITKVKEFHLDPGGIICLKNPILKENIDGYEVSIRQELILSMIYVWTKYAKKDENGYIRIYVNNFDVLVITDYLYNKIGAWLTSKKGEAYVAKASLNEALSNHPNIYIAPIKTEGDA